MALSMRPAMAPSYRSFSLLFVLILILSIGKCAKLNAPKVLLPYYSSVITNFTLEVKYSPEEAQIANCYRWRSTRPEVAQVQLVGSKDGVCSQSVVVSAVSKTSHQMTTVVLAENKVTGEVLRTNVIVSQIVRVEIETTTRLLYLEDSPEELVVRGYDSEGNIFSNLKGMSFEWSLISDTETGHDVVDAHNILRIKRFSDSHYTTPAHIGPLEDRGLQGDTILVEGIRTGSAKVAAKLRDPVYKSISAHEVRIVVIANLVLSPPDAYVIPLGRVKYKVEILRHNAFKEIKMPSKQYYLDVQDTSICRLEAQTSLATAKIIGSTEIVLKDRNIVATEFSLQPSAMLHVVNPGFLAFVVLPHRKWVLETGREYEILIEIFDTDSHKMYPSDNVRVVADFSSTYFNVLFSSVNGTYHRVRTLQKGETIIDGALVSVVDENGREHGVHPEVKRNQDVEIYDPVTVSPSEVLFPWDPVTRCVHRFTATASGGSGEYVWSASDTSVASVNIQGQISSVGPGKCNITAADAKNSAHFSIASLHVLPPADMNFPLSKVEAVIGSTLTLPLAVFAKIDKRLVTFTDCRQLPLNISFSDGSIFEHVFSEDSSEQAIPENGCTSLTFLAKRQGHTEVIATYRSVKVFLQASVTIAAYNPLTPINPPEEAVVALGASMELLFRGGPQPWVLDSSKFYEDLKPEKQELLQKEKSANLLNNRGFHAFNVLCLDFGEQEVFLSVGNGKTAKNQFPASETVSVRFVCARPVELHLIPDLHLNPDLPACPVTHETHLPMPVYCGKDLDILVTVTDSNGRKFDNFSSLSISWTISSSNLAELLHLRELPSNVETDSDGRKSISTYQTMKPYGRIGSVVITAKIDRYKTSALKALRKQHQERITPIIKKSLELILVEQPELSPSSVAVFNYPSNKVDMSLQHGSGYFYLPDLESQIIQAKYDQKSKEIHVSPLRDGTQSITVFDLCLDIDTQPSASISVSGIGSIEVVVIDKVEVLKEVEARVQVLDLRGKPLLASFFKLMGLKLDAASEIVTLHPSSGQVEDGVTGVYTVYGAVVGHTTLTASVRLPNGKVIYSAPKPLEVFPPLRLEPKNTTLIIGSKLQILAFGGPQPQSNVEFSIVNSNVATISSGGLVDSTDLGTTRIVGKAVGVDSLTGQKVIYSEDDAIVNVVALKGIRIHAPLTRLQTDTQMPVYAVGLTEQETPFTFGSAIPPLVFSWSVNSREVLQLQSVYHQSGIQLPKENNFAQQVVAKETGHVSLRLQVSPHPDSRFRQIYNDLSLTDEVQIQVFERLTLINPNVCNGQIRITPNTETFLKSNRDVAARVRYSVIGDNSETPVVRLMSNGQLRSGPIPGEAVLEVLAEEEFGLNQTLVILVKVKPVSYLMINADTTILTSSNQLAAIPVGTTLEFSVSYHDDVGESFYATNIQLGIRASRYDLLHVSNGADNNTLIVRAAEIGNTVLKVWDKKHPVMADYINVPVGYAITPSQTHVTLGTVVCFASPIIPSSRSHHHAWDSKPSSVLEMDKSRGIGTAVSVGRSTVHYAFSGSASTKTDLIVDPIHAVSVEPAVSFLTNQQPAGTTKDGGKGHQQFFEVRFNQAGNVQGPNCTSVIGKTEFSPHFLPYVCRLEFSTKYSEISVSDLFLAKAHFDSATGIHGCQVSQLSQNALPAPITATLDSSIRLSVHVPSSLHKGQPEVNSMHLNLEFLPAFHVHGSDLHLSTVSRLASIRVSASAAVLSDIQVVVSDSVLLEALSPERDAVSKHVVLFPVRLLESLTLWERPHLDLWVELTHPRTGHVVKVPVLVKMIGAKPQMPHASGPYRQEISWSNLLTSTISNYQSWLVICFIILVTAAAVLVAYHAIVGQKYKVTSNSNVFLNQSGGIQPSPQSSFIQRSPTLGLGTPGYTHSSSPTSPKLWSVSYNQQDSTSPYKRNPRYSSSPMS